MVDVVIPAPCPPVANASVGGALLGALLQALTWAAFGFCLCGGWHFMEFVLRKA